MTNNQLRAALESKLRPGAPYSEHDLTAFAIGVEWGAATECERCAKIAEQVIDPVDSPLTDLSSNAARLIAGLIRERSN